MSELASKVVNLPRTEPNRVTVFGKILAVKALEKKGEAAGYATRISLPAGDKYSNAQTVEVITKAKLGAKNEEITIECMLHGYIQRTTNKETGEQYEFPKTWLKVVED